MTRRGFEETPFATIIYCILFVRKSVIIAQTSAFRCIGDWTIAWRRTVGEKAYKPKVGVNSSFVALTTLVLRFCTSVLFIILAVGFCCICSFFGPLVMKLICPNDRMNMTETKNWEQETKLRIELAPSVHRLLPCRMYGLGLGTNKQLWCILYSLFKRLYMYCSLANEYPRAEHLKIF